MWAWIGGGGLGAVGAIVALWALWSREKAKRERDKARASLTLMTKNLAVIASELDMAIAMSVKTDNVINYLKGEIDGLEKDLDACSKPGDVRDRVRRMLQVAKDHS